jgi:uncharacterized protein (DUF302 family)
MITRSQQLTANSQKELKMKKLLLLSILLAFMSSCNTAKKEKNTKDVEKKQEVTERNVAKPGIKFVLFQSDYNPKSTYQKLKGYLESKGMFYPRAVDHSTAAANVQMELNEEYLMVFGNPKMGTFLMQENPEVGIELPLKVLIYQDDEKRTWVMYKDMNYLKTMYFLKDPNGVIEKMNNLQEGFKKAVFNPIRTSQITEDEIK